MDLIKCPICGEEYSPSYKSCPFCEEYDEHPVKKRAAKRHITSRRKMQSARGGIIVVLALVLALFGWYLFGDKLPQNDVQTEPPSETAHPPAQSADEPSDDEPPGETGPVESDEPPAPAVHVDAASLAIKTNVSGTLSKDPASGFYDCSVKKSDQIRLIVTGTDVEVSEWSAEDSGVVAVDGEGWLKPVKSGVTNVTATVGDAKVTCIVRVR